MPTEYRCHSDREIWLSDRNIGIGASEASIIRGYSKWQTITDLWRVKTGKSEPQDISSNDAVSYGVNAENALRELFMAKMSANYTLEYHPYDMLYQSNRPWLYATLDGELTDIESGEKGILEIKTCSPRGKYGWAEWDGKIPDCYYCQICHQFLATNFDFAYLMAELNGSNPMRSEIRIYYFEKDNCTGDIQDTLSAEVEFWDCVKRDRQPATVLTL